MRKFITTILVASLVFTTGPGQAWAFSDTSQHWAEKDINRLYSQQIVNGENGNFYPNQPVTRAQFAKLIVSALGLAEDVATLKGVKTQYWDVPASYWAAGYITIAEEKGIVKGYTDGSFHPNAQIKRSEIAVMLMRALAPLSEELYDGPLGFADQAEIPQWAQKQVSQAVQLELIKGYQDNTFRPNKATTRAEAATLLTRYLGILGRPYDFIGTVQNIDTKLNTLTIQVNGKDSIFLYSPETKIYNDQQLISLSQIQSGERVYFNLDQLGYITYLEVTSDLPEKNFEYLGGVPKPATILANQELKLSNHKLMLAEEDGVPADTNKPEESLQITKKAMEVPQFATETKATGTGQLIAIIDTGVDAGHPDLLADELGKKKIVDWEDYTDEGKVATVNRGTPSNGYLILDKAYDIGKIVSRSGVMKLGFLTEESIITETGGALDMNSNGKGDDQYPVLVVDAHQSGDYDTVYIDTNNNQSFTDEMPLQVYKQGKQFTQITGANDSKFDLVAAEIDSSGDYVKIGFDGNGHGTHVAGIAAANGQLQGVAPGADLMVLKVINSQGAADWNNIVRAIEYAAKNGAKIINLSLGYRAYDPRGDSWEDQIINKIIDRYHVTLVVAAGNSGPGMATMAIPANSSKVISVGAYISPEMWAHEFGYQVPNDSLWYFSSMGPRGDGAFMPTIVAPGSAVSTVNFRKYDFMEGTSMAAPHVAGAIALLSEAAAKAQIAVTPESLKKAVALGARHLTGFNEVEQGHGVLNLPNAWKIIQDKQGVNSFSSQVFNRVLTTGEGLYTENLEPAELLYKIFNQTAANHTLQLNSTQDWLKLDRSEITVAAQKSRSFNAQFNLPQEPGVYTALITGTVENSDYPDLQILNTLVKPYQFDDQQQVQVTGDLGPALYKRYFFKVNPGTKQLDLNLAIPDDGKGGYQGRVRVHLFGPDGVEYQADDYQFAGMNPYGNTGSVEKQIADPKAGVWEAVVYSSAMLGKYNLDSSHYTLKAQITPGDATADSTTKPDLLIDVLTSKIYGNKTKFATIQLRYRLDKRPYQGVVEINGRIYSVNNGKVLITVPADQTDPVIRVSTIE